MSNTGVKHISRVNGYYIISKTLNGKTNYYGCFKSLTDAIKYKGYCEEHNWDDSCIPPKRSYTKQGNLKNIQNINDIGWQVNKVINGVKTHYGWFKTLQEAKEHRDYCEEHNWSRDCILRRNRLHGLPKYITINKDKYVLQKYRSDGSILNIRFNRLEDAVKERDLLMKCGWSEERLMELDEAYGSDYCGGSTEHLL